MKILHQNPRAGIMKVMVENLDDLWYLSLVIRAGDLVRTKSERRLKPKDDMGRSKKGERKVFTLAVRVEKADFSSDADTYRVLGKIEEGPADLVSIGSYHTFNVEKGTAISIIKEKWTPTEVSKIREAQKASLRPKILIVVVDEGEATYGLVRESKIEYYELSKAIGGKYDQSGRKKRKEEFYAEAGKFIKDLTEKENLSAIVVAGAGFEKENFMAYLKDRQPGLAGKAVLENIGSYGRNGISEVMKRDGVKKIIEDIESARDEEMVSEVLGEIGKDSGLAVYGLPDVERAVQSGAASKIMVADDLFLQKREKIESLLSAVKDLRGQAHLVNHEGDPGKKLHAIGGIAAVLRYSLD